MAGDLLLRLLRDRIVRMGAREAPQATRGRISPNEWDTQQLWQANPLEQVPGQLRVRSRHNWDERQHDPPFQPTDIPPEHSIYLHGLPKITPPRNPFAGSEIQGSSTADSGLLAHRAREFGFDVPEIPQPFQPGRPTADQLLEQLLFPQIQRGASLEEVARNAHGFLGMLGFDLYRPTTDAASIMLNPQNFRNIEKFVP